MHLTKADLLNVLKEAEFDTHHEFSLQGHGAMVEQDGKLVCPLCHMRQNITARLAGFDDETPQELNVIGLNLTLSTENAATVKALLATWNGQAPLTVKLDPQTAKLETIYGVGL